MSCFQKIPKTEWKIEQVLILWEKKSAIRKDKKQTGLGSREKGTRGGKRQKSPHNEPKQKALLGTGIHKKDQVKKRLEHVTLN